MAFTTADLDAINKAIASGALAVRYPDGSSVNYRSLDEMIRTRDMIAAVVAPPATAASNPRVSLVSFAGVRP